MKMNQMSWLEHAICYLGVETMIAAVVNGQVKKIQIFQTQSSSQLFVVLRL